MAEANYSIVFKGEMLDGYPETDVKDGFKRLFRIDDQRTEKMFSGQPCLLKKVEDRESALKYQDALNRIGARCDIQEKPGAPSPEIKLKPKTNPNDSIDSDSRHPLVPVSSSPAIPEVKVLPPDAPHSPRRPVGKPRSVLAIFFFSLITLGIYGVVYYYSTFEEMKNWRGQGWSGGLYLLFQFLFPIPLVALPWLLPAYVGRMYAEDGQPRPVTGYAGWWLLIPILGTIIWLVKIQHSLNRFWIAKGAHG